MSTSTSESRVSLPLHLLIPDPDQPRKNNIDDESLEEITASVREQGVLQELLVEGPMPSGKYQIVYGERRYRAALKAGLVDVPVRVVAPLSPSERLEIQLFENMMRRDLDIRERAAAISRYVSTFPDQKSAAAKLGLSEGRLSQMLELATLKPEVSQLASDGLVRDSSTLVMINQLVKHSPDDAVTIIEKARADGKLSRKEVSVALAPFRRKKTTKSVAESDVSASSEEAPFSQAPADAGQAASAERPENIDVSAAKGPVEMPDPVHTPSVAENPSQVELPGFEEVRPDKMKRVRSTLNISGVASSRVVIAKLVDAYLSLLEQVGGDAANIN